jgi:ubiquinone/menaquinone biosynthesis C-methylase UbiE
LNAHAHHHGHHHDQGARAVLRYLKLLPFMWRSALNEAVVRELAIQPGERVVDLGSGAGAASVAAARRGALVIAIDPMPFMRGVLELRRRLHPGASIRVQAGAAEAIPVEDRSVDALWSVNTLHHWTHREAAARELARVLKPGARVLLLDEDVDDTAHPHHSHGYAQRRRTHGVFEEVDPAALAQSLSAAGFASATGEKARLAGRPVKWVRATR